MGVFIGWLVISCAALCAFFAMPTYSLLKSAVTISLILKIFFDFARWMFLTFLFWIATILFILPAAISKSPIALIVAVFAYMGSSYWLGRLLKIEPGLNRVLFSGAAPLQAAVFLSSRLKASNS